MNLRTMRFLLLCCGMFFLWVSCDTGVPITERDDGQQDPTGPGDPGNVVLPPSLLRIEGADGPVGPGDVITLVGLNFSPVLANNQVFFDAGNNRVEGLVINVIQVGETTATGSVEYNLDVVIPGGVSRGTVALRVNGRDAGGVSGFDINPTLMGFTLGENNTNFELLYGIGATGGQERAFQDGNSRVTVYGLNLADVREVQFGIGAGQPNDSIASDKFIRNPVQAQPGVQPSGSDSIAFDLKYKAEFNNDLNLPLTTTDILSNMSLRLRGSGEVSNRLMIPVITDSTASREDRSGAVISSVNVPVGVVSGPVPIRYTCYEAVVGSEWEMDVQFRVFNPSLTTPSAWLPATPFIHPDNSGKDNNGKTGMYMGSPLHRSGHRLLPGIGATRTFIWDAPVDPRFREIREAVQDNGQLKPRFWRVEFRLTPRLTSQNRLVRERFAETPPVVYYDLQDRPGDIVTSQRRAELFETFNDSLFVDRELTTAIWGPPVNPGFLSGGTNPPEESTFGEGTAVMVLQEVNPEDFLDLAFGETLLDEYVEFNTDRMEVIHHIVKLVPADDGSINLVDFTFLELFRDATGSLVENPGEDLGEFHLESLRLLGGEYPLPDGSGRVGIDDAQRTNPFRLVGRGSRPLVIRLSGGGVTASDDAEVLVVEVTEHESITIDPDTGEEIVESYSNPAIVTVSGTDGGPGSPFPCPCPPNCGLQNGGGGTPGAGGGAGGDGAQLFILFGTLEVTQLADAEPGGNFGGGGGETPAAVDFDESTKSILHGAPGGGGGHRVTGGDGEYGTSTIAQYQEPRPGRGGIQRGSPEQLVITAGSGGGGGGASLSRVQAAAGPFFTAAGAGGGGGAGAVAFFGRGTLVVDGFIEANGGDGGDAEMPRTVTPPCTPYPSGADQIATGAPGGGGSGGTIILRATGDVLLADCANLEVEGGEAGSSRTARTMNRTQGRGDGALGYIRIESATREVDYCGDLPVEPDDSLSEGGLADAPDDLATGRGQDGVLHLRFIRSIDPLTGLPRRDPETGREISVWTYNTGTGELVDPLGDAFRTRVPGVIDVSRLLIDEDVVLRALGPEPLRVLVREIAEISGTIDVSGFPGGALRFEFPGQFPEPGLGGRGGPAGADGGSGGTVQFAGDAVIPVDGEAGGSPLDALGASLPDVLVPVATEVVPAGPGGTVPGQSGVCDNPCDSAGGGAGGGHYQAGEAGRVPTGSDPQLAGQPGSDFGFDSVRFAGELFLYGGLGGGGGGANPQVSAAYANRRIRGSYPFPGAATYAPGTGGGGGGGVLHLVANSLQLRPSARLLARGGNAYQSIDLAGNGGAGAGGTIVIQVIRNLEIREGAQIDVSGGVANRLPPINPEGLRSYEGNIRTRFLDSFPDEFNGDNDAQKQVFGGRGGDGSPGRVRIEAPFISRATDGPNESVSTGVFLSDTVQTVAVSQPIQLGLGSTFVAGAQYELSVDVPRLVLSPLQPPGTDLMILWEGARQSMEVHAGIGELLQSVRDPRDLELTEFVRYRVYFQSNFISRSSQSLQQLTLPYRLTLPNISF